jgi:polyisoprenoid-binding protein YceI
MSASTQLQIPTGTWTADPAHTTVGFSVKHLGISNVHGTFDEFEGTLVVDSNDLSTARITGSIKTASVNTNEPPRDEHLRSADFFDAEQYPELRFESTDIEADDDELTIQGNLTIHGVTNPITLRGEITGLESDPWGNERVGLEIAGSLSRGDYGMKFNQALGSGNVLVGDKVKLRLDISAIRGDGKA